MKVLIESGADVNVTASNSWTLLHSATLSGKLSESLHRTRYVERIKILNLFSSGHEHIARILIESGLDPNMKNCDGFTPLHLAAVLGRENIVKFLVENNGNVNEQANAGHTPLYLATQSGKFKHNLDRLKF